MWFQIAARLGHKSVRAAKRAISSLEFVEWGAFFEWEINNQVRVEDHYAMQLTAEVRRSWLPASERRNVKSADFKITFTRPVETKEDALSPEIQLANSKAFWLHALGINKKESSSERDGT